MLQTGTGRCAQVAEPLLHPHPRLWRGLLTWPAGTPSAQSQAEGHPLISFENPPRILENPTGSWKYLQHFRRSPAIRGLLMAYCRTARHSSSWTGLWRAWKSCMRSMAVWWYTIWSWRRAASACQTYIWMTIILPRTAWPNGRNWYWWHRGSILSRWSEVLVGFHKKNKNKDSLNPANQLFISYIFYTFAL